MANTSFVLPRSSYVSGRVPCPDGAVSVPVYPSTALPLPATGRGNVAIFGRGRVWTDAVPKALQDPCSSQNTKRTRPTMAWKEKGTTRSEQKTIISYALCVCVCLKLLCILLWTLALSQVKRNWKRLTLSPKPYKNPGNSQIMKMYIIIIIDRLYIALFSALESRLTALACDSTWVNSFL